MSERGRWIAVGCLSMSLVTGCAEIFGIDEWTPEPGDATNAAGGGGGPSGSSSASAATSSGPGSASSGSGSASSGPSSTSSGAGCQCPASTECVVVTCEGNLCVITPAAAGTPVGGPAGDCNARVCDGTGATVVVADPGDVPDDALECTVDVCNGATAVHTPAAAGLACTQGGGTLCDGAGSCIGCLEGSQCASGVCAGTQCQPPTCEDDTQNGVETDVDCGGGECGKCGEGDTCLEDDDCKGKYDCIDGTCEEGD